MTQVYFFQLLLLFDSFKFLCRAFAGYVLAQLPEMKGNPQIVRHQANAPCTVGQPGGNTECAKVLLKLDFGQSQGQIKDCAELALKQVKSNFISITKYGILSDLITLLVNFELLKVIIQ